MLEATVPFLTSFITLIGTIYVTSRINWQLALVALLIAPFILLVSQAYRAHLRKLAHRVTNAGKLRRLDGAGGLGSAPRCQGIPESITRAVVMYVGVRQVQVDAVTLGDLLLVMDYLLQLYEPLKSISEIIGRL